MIEVTEKQITELYRSVNEMMCQLGMKGYISTKNKESQDVMDDLANIDGGEYDEHTEIVFKGE